MKNNASCTQRAALCFVLSGLTLLSGQLAAQVTLEVNQNDPNATYQTINAAVADAKPGDTILVHPGTYLEKLKISGITLKALRGPEVTVVKSSDGTGDGITLAGNANVTLIGFRVQGFVNGIVVDTNGGDTRVANCVAAGNSAVGMVLGASVPLSAKIANNIAADNGGDALFVKRRGWSSYGDYTSVINNISYRNGGYGILWEDFSGYRAGDYNCAFANSRGQFWWAEGAGTHSITTDPLLDVTKQYRFASQGSSAANTGHPADSYLDPDGSRCDMGAYGGPEARNWWRDPFGGPTVENVTVDPPQARPGGKIAIRATARTE
jgi:hypothetical protein